MTSMQKILDLSKIKDHVEAQETMKHHIAPVTPSHSRSKKTGTFLHDTQGVPHLWNSLPQSNTEAQRPSST